MLDPSGGQLGGTQRSGPGADSTRPDAGRLYDYVLGVTERLAVDRPIAALRYLRSEAERFFDGMELLPPRRGGAPGVTYTGLRQPTGSFPSDRDGVRWT